MDEEGLFRLALQAANGGAWDWDLTLDEAWWSEEMYRLWGVDPGTPMRLENSLALVHEQDREVLRGAVGGALARGGDYQCEFRIRHPVLGERWMASHGRLVFDASGRVVRMRGITMDITARKQAEQQRDQYRKDLRTVSSELLLTEERGRRQLAQDLHDGLGQALFLARMKLEQASLDGQAARELGSILDEAGRTVNALTFELSPPVLHELGLPAAIRWLVKDLKKRYGLSVDVDHDGAVVPLEEGVAVVVFRAVRELLINTAKHARIDCATVSLRRKGGSVEVTVEDRGRGFSMSDRPRHVEAGHFGLFGLRERLEYVGGTFEIRSQPGQGTKAILTAPAGHHVE